MADPTGFKFFFSDPNQLSAICTEVATYSTHPGTHMIMPASSWSARAVMGSGFLKTVKRGAI